MKKIKTLTVVLLFALFINNVEAKDINVYLVHSEKCGYCQNANKFFDSYIKKHKNITVYKYSVLDEKDSETISKIEDTLNKNTTSIPVIIIGEKFIVGFNDQIQKQIVEIIENYEKNDYYDPLGEALGIKSKDALNKNEEIDTNISTPTVKDEIHEVEAKEQKENVFTSYTYEIIIGIFMLLLFILEIIKFKSSK